MMTPEQHSNAIETQWRRVEAADQMFPDLAPEARSLAYALIEAGLCFHTCDPDCRGRCVQAAENAIRAIGLDT